MQTSFSYAQDLQSAAERYMVMPAGIRTPQNKREHKFIHGGYKPKGLFDLKRSDVVWTLIPFAKLLAEHQPFSQDWTVLRKYHKAGIVGVKIPGGPTIRGAAAKPVGLTIDKYIEAHNWVNDYLWNYGVTFSSFSWASEQLFRTMLKRGLKVGNPIGRRMLKTSRGLCIPGKHPGPLEKWDIRGAYPSAMLKHGHRFPTGVKPIHHKEWEKHHSLVLAYVRVRPTDRPIQVPIIQEHPSDNVSPVETVNWFWDFELNTILENGHHVQPLMAYRVITSDLSDELGSWHEVLNLRYTDETLGFAGKLLKGIANSLWGSFVSSPIGQFHYLLNNERIELDEWASEHYTGRAGGEHVASWVNALVSDRVFNEFLNKYEVIYFDTDGGYVKPLPEPIGNGEFGEWSYEGIANQVEIMSWQAYAAWSDYGLQVKMSGVPNASLQDLYRWGSNRDRSLQLQELAMDRGNQLIRAVHKTENIVSPLGPEHIAGREKWYAMISKDVAPDVTLFDVADDSIEVAPEQAEAFRRLATWDTEKMLS